MGPVRFCWTGHKNLPSVQRRRCASASSISSSAGRLHRRDDFRHCHDSVNLTANSFSKFNKLNTLIISNTRVAKIDDQAFAGIGDTLQELRLVNTGLSAFPTTALKPLTNLERLYLTDNNMQVFTADDFASLQKLQSLMLDGNNAAAAGNAGAFSKLTPTGPRLSLSRPTPPLDQSSISKLFNQAPQIRSLFLDKNAITAIKKAVF